MSLSDDEQRILNEMEAQLAESDPRLVDDVTSTTVYTAALKNIKWAILLFLVGIAVMIALLSVHFLLSALGFAIMLVAVLMFEKSLTQIGKAGLNQMMQKSKKSGGLTNALRKNMKDRFNKKNDA